MDTYVYAPKDDPNHRSDWRTPLPPDEIEGFAELVADATLQVGFTVSPGLTMDLESTEDRAVLLEKLHRMSGLGISLVGLLLDDLDPSEGLGARHGELTAWLRRELDPTVELFMVPLHYTGTDAPPYLRELAARVPDDVAIGWTGRHVVNRTVTVGDARAWSAAMGGRHPLLWDNTPVNDVLMADHLFTGPLRGRDRALPDHLSGYLANPMIQARASLPALLSAAAWCRGEDPERAWSAALGEHRVLFEGCDGELPRRLTAAALDGDDAAADELDGWLAEAERCEAGDLGDEVQPWVDQLRAESEVARVALQLWRGDRDEARRAAPLLYVMWPQVCRGRAQVLGGRGAMLPVLGQDEQSRWVASSESWVSPASVTDRLVGALFARLG